jgi:hypothetical protein
MNTLTTRISLAPALLFFFLPTQAAEPPNPVQTNLSTAQQHSAEPPLGPPPEAYKACEGMSLGGKTEFVNPRGETVAGVCQNDGSGKIVLRPDHTPGERHGPPPEAYQVCVGKTSGNAAQFTGPKGEIIQGTCQAEGERLVLRPYHPPTAKTKFDTPFPQQ